MNLLVVAQDGYDHSYVTGSDSSVSSNYARIQLYCLCLRVYKS